MAFSTHLTRQCSRIWSKLYSRGSRSLLKSPLEIVNATPSLSSLASISHHRQDYQSKTSETTRSHNGISLTQTSFPCLLTVMGGSSEAIATNPSLSPVFIPVRNYQSALRPRLHCKGCYYVWRHGRKFVECSDVPSHKQMKKLATRKVWLEDYTRGNVARAMKWNRDWNRIAHRHVDRTVISHNWLASRIGKDV